MAVSPAAQTRREHPARGLRGKKDCHTSIPFRISSPAHSWQAAIHCDINAGG